MHITAAAVDRARGWDETVLKEHEQTARFRDPPPDDAPWTGLAWNFAAPDRDEKDLDPAVGVLEKYLDRSDSVIDVGAGAGRLAIPLARRCASVVAVEPSPSMRQRMDASIREMGVDNVRVVPDTWQVAEIEPGDHVICSHVIYATTPILPFVEKLNDHAKKRVTVMLRERPPQANFHQLFELLSGESRIALPAMPNFRGLLEALEIDYDLHRLEDRPHGIFPTPEAALKRSTMRLFLNPGSEKAERLAEILPDCLVPEGDGVRFEWAEPQRGWLVSWSTA